MKRTCRLLFAVIFLSLSGKFHHASAQQTSIIPITETTTSNGAFVRGASNDGKRIVFESTNDYTGENRDANNEIFVYDANLRKIIQITKTGSQTGSGGAGGGATLNSINCPGGCEPGQFTPVNTVPAISGDGTRIVFASSSGLLTNVPNLDGNVEIYLATLPSGSSVATFQRITETDGLRDIFDNNTPTINFDGSVIAFASTRRFFKARGVQIFTSQNDEGNAQIYVYEVSSQRFTQVTHKRVDEGILDFEVRGFISNPFISGNGQVLAFLSGYNFSGNAPVNNADLNGEIFIYRVGDPINQVRQVTNTTDQADVPEDGAVNVLSRFSKHLSDDGSLLVFESAGGASPVKTGERIRDVFIYNLNTNTFTQVTTQDIGKRALSDFNYFPSVNGPGTFVTFSSKLNLPVINDTAGNFNNSREVYRYDIAGSSATLPRFFLATQTEVSTNPSDQRQILLAPFLSDDGATIAFSNNGNLMAAKLSTTVEVFQAVLRPVVREGGEPILTNSASFERTAIARGSIATAFGIELANSKAESNETDNYPFELEGVSVTVGDSLSGIAGRMISISPGQINFVFPTGIAADDEVSFLINNNGVISRGRVNVRDAAPGFYAVRNDGTGPARAQCSRASDNGQETQNTAMPCQIGFEGATNSIILYATGVRFGVDIRVRFRFQLGNGEEDEIETTPSYANRFIDENGKEHLGMDQVIVPLQECSADTVCLADRINVDTKVVLTTNNESVTSQDGITTAFSSFDEDLAVINAASQESGPVARGSIALALTQNNDDEDDTFTAQTISASPFNPPLELAGIRVTVAGESARILAVSSHEVKFILPAEIEPSANVLVQLTNGVKVFNTRVSVQDAAPGLTTETGDGLGKAAAKCGQILDTGAIVYTSPPCALSNGAEKRILVLTGTGWRFASGVRVTFDNIDLIPAFAGAEPGIPGVDRIEIALTPDLAEDIAGRERDLIVRATINGETANSQSGVTVAFQETSEIPQEQSELRREQMRMRNKRK